MLWWLPAEGEMDPAPRTRSRAYGSTAGGFRSTR